MHHVQALDQQQQQQQLLTDAAAAVITIYECRSSLRSPLLAALLSIGNSGGSSLVVGTGDVHHRQLDRHVAVAGWSQVPLSGPEHSSCGGSIACRTHQHQFSSVG
jgi:hypothetical protein